MTRTPQITAEELPRFLRGQGDPAPLTDVRFKGGVWCGRMKAIQVQVWCRERAGS